jgi:hypothetical protein
VLSYRSIIAAILAFYLVLGPAVSALAADAATPCESMGSMSQPLPDDCCGDAMNAAACLSACIAASSVAVAGQVSAQRLEASDAAIPSISLRYATIFAPPDSAPPKPSVS